MIFNFERDHSEINSKISDAVEYKYLREFYLRFNSRGVYANHLDGKTSFKTIEKYLNSNITLTSLVCNSILGSNSELFIKYTIDSVPTCVYKSLLKSALYTNNDYAVHLLIKNWPFETLELGEYFQEAYSLLLLFYKTDINSFTGKLPIEILKWLLIGSKYTKLITSLFFKNQLNESCKLRTLDLTGLPIADRLLDKLLNKHVHALCINTFDTDDAKSIDFYSSSDSTGSSSSRIVSYSDLDDNSDLEIDSDLSEDFLTDDSVSSDSDFDFKAFVSKCRNRVLRPESKKSSSDSLESQNSFKMEKYKIILDAILVNFTLFEKYVKLVEIKEDKFEKNKSENIFGFELIVNKLDITIHSEKFCLENRHLDLEALKITGLGVFFNASFNESLYAFNLVQKFKNIQDLNLSAFGRESSLRHVLDNPTVIEVLSNSLKTFKGLKRLRLNIPGIRNNLKYLLKDLTNPLEYLNLTSCGLDASDLNFLSESIHVNSINNLVLCNDDLSPHYESLIALLKKMTHNLQVLDLGCNSFSFNDYYKIVDEAISKMENLAMLVTLDVFTFDNYVKIADKLCNLKKFISWRINYSSDYYERSVKIKSKFKFKKFKTDYAEALEKKFLFNSDKKLVKITINDPDLNFILNEIF